MPETLGEFVVEHELGRGGSGVVYAARWGYQEVALKVLRLDEAPTGKERERFLAEARNLARVIHPGVVKVLAVGELPDGRPYLAMERLRGGTLAERLLMQRIPVEQALVLFEQLVAAVGALHAAGLIHRDIKPENVMLVDSGKRLVLLDFGIARGVDDLPSTTTQAGLQRGTPAYMAPERFFGARATVSSDVYETAVVLYVMVTGDLPWKDPRSPKERLSPRAPSELGVVLPAGLEATLMKALGPEPVHRPATIAALVSEVRRVGWDGDTKLQGGGEVAQRTTGGGAGKTERVAKRGVVIAVGLVAAFGAAVAVAVMAIGKQPAAEAAAEAVPVAAPEPVAAAAEPVVTELPVVVVLVDAGVAPVDAAAAPVKKVRKPGASGTGTGTGSAAPSAQARAAISDCRKIAALYCGDEFIATEGTMGGSLCKTMNENVDDWERLPADARDAQADWCRSSFDQMAAAVGERLRMFREGMGPK